MVQQMNASQDSKWITSWWVRRSGVRVVLVFERITQTHWNKQVQKQSFKCEIFVRFTLGGESSSKVRRSRSVANNLLHMHYDGKSKCAGHRSWWKMVLVLQTTKWMMMMMKCHELQGDDTEWESWAWTNCTRDESRNSTDSSIAKRFWKKSNNLRRRRRQMILHLVKWSAVSMHFRTSSEAYVVVSVYGVA